MKISRRKMPEPHIPFISLADIAWQIIIFFFMAASFTKNEALKIDAPSTSPQATAVQEKNLTVLASSQAISIDGKAVPLEQLTAELASKLKDRKKPEQRVVIVEGRDDLTFQRDADVMYAIQKAGGIPMIAEDK